MKEARLLEYLAGYISDHKRQVMEKVLNQRTRHLTVVLEDIYQPQNASAVLRTADCFGIQDVHVIENKHKFKLNPRVVHGSSKWLDIHRYNESADNTKDCINQLKKSGYRLVATVPDQNATAIHDLDLRHKSALVFGTEMTGLSDQFLKEADEQVTIPMYGFTESLNISVSVAITLNTLIEKLFSSEVNWKLNEEDKSLLRLEWYRRSVNRSDLLEKEFLKSH